MKYKNKLTPEVHRMIIKLASSLPPLQRTINGKPASRAGSEFKGTKGFNTNGKAYKNVVNRYSEPLMVNHKLKLIEAWEDHGQAGIKSYVAEVQRIVREWTDKKEGNADNIGK